MASYEVPGARAPGNSRLKHWLGPRPVFQIILALLLAGLAAFLVWTLLANMSRAGLSPGFAFLWRPANFEIGESFISFSAQDSVGRAIIVGLLNTLVVSFLGCVLATILGVVLGIARLSSNPLVSGAVRGYVEVIRNTPLLLQLFFWMSLLQNMPAIRNALEPLPGFLFSNRGLFIPSISFGEGYWPVIFIAATVFLLGLWSFVSSFLRENPVARHQARIAILIIAVIILFVMVAQDGLSVTWPERKGFNVSGGLSATPEFVALLLGLVVNAAAGIAEIVRSGIESVPRGQWEAAHAMGLHRGQTMRLVVLPQALRVIIPLMTSSYLSLTKNSSLAVAIGYPDLVNIINTTANQTGQALEAILIMMGIYLSISLSTSFMMNKYNARHALRTR